MTVRSSVIRHPASPANSAQGRKVVNIASGKGGVGKTWLSISLAHALSRMGRRILLFDGDLGLANVDIQLGLSATYDLAQVLAGRIELADSVTRVEDGGFDVVAGRSGSGSLAALPKEKLLDLRDRMHRLAGQYDTVLVDMGAGIDMPVRILGGGAGTCLVVTTGEPTALTDAYAFIKVTAMQNPGTALRIVVNSALSQEDGRRTYETLKKATENFLKLSPPLAGIIRRDPKVPQSIRNQTSLLTRYPNSDAAQDVERIARTLVEGM